MELSGIAEVLGGEKVLGKKIRSQMDLIELGNDGVTKDALRHLAKNLSITMDQMAELLLISERTIQRYASKKHFSRPVSEQILRIAEVAANGIQLFDDREKFLTWMNHPNRALANKTPKSLLSSRFGAGMVLDVLGRIEYGVFS